MSNAKKASAADIVGILGDVISLISKAIAGGKEANVKKILGAELHTTLIKTRADLEAIVRFK